MAESVSFKAYLKRDGQEVEVRRFGIDSGAATNYLYLQGKIQAVFPSIHNDQFNLFWQDADNDYVSVGSDEELLEALTATTVQPLKLYIKTKGAQSQSTGDKQTHVGITCDGCNNPVVGRRFKCVTCPDFDLCGTCEASGQHSDHFMLRITSPFGPQMHPKFFRKFFGRPHKFFKHGMGHCSTGDGARSCPMGRPERAREGLGAAGVTDMFDFSALMEFINSLGLSMAAGQREASESQAQAAGTGQPAAAAAQASASLSAPAPEQRQGPAAAGRPVDYLSNIGQAITELLDPFDENAKKCLKRRFITTKKALIAHKTFRERRQLKDKNLNTKYTSKVFLVSPNDRRSCIILKQGSDSVCFHHMKHGRQGCGKLKPCPENGPSGRGTQRPGPNEGHSLDRQGRHGHGPHGHGHGPHGHGHSPHGHGHGPHGHRHGPHGHGHGPHGAGSDGRQFPKASVGNQGRNTEGQLVPPLITLDGSPTAYGVDVSFEVRPKSTETQEAGPSAPARTPAATEPPTPRNTGSPVVIASAPAPAATEPSTPRNTGSPVLASAPAPAVAEPFTASSTGSPVVIASAPAPAVPEPAAAARRNSDDWTLLNRESPTRNMEVAAMEVEEVRGAGASSAMYPQLPREVISVPVNKEDQKIQEAAERILSMGFSFDRTVLYELLKQANCDIASVLEKLLSNRK